MTIDQMIEVLNAFNAGKKIQYSVKNAANPMWLDTAYPAWDFITYEYRAKPEPRTYYLAVDAAGKVCGAGNNPTGIVIFCDPRQPLPPWNKYSTVKVVEQL